MSPYAVYLSIVDRPLTNGSTSIGAFTFGWILNLCSFAEFLQYLQAASLILGCAVAILTIIGWIRKYRNGGTTPRKQTKPRRGK